MTRKAREGKLPADAVESLIASIEINLAEDSPLRALALELLHSDHPEVFFEFPEIVAQGYREKGSIDGELVFRASAPLVVEAISGLREADDQQRLVVTVEELIRLNESGVVSLDTGNAENILLSELEDAEASFERSIRKMAESFSLNRLDHPLLTTGTDLELGDAASSDGLDLTRANRAVLAASMLADIPSFPTASVDEILDIRERVQIQLGRFRAAVADLEQELGENVSSDDFAASVEDLKLRRVAPELEELRESLRDEGLAQTASRTTPYLATGVLGLGASLAIGAPELASAVAVSAGAATAVAKEMVERARFDRERKKHRLFLLFDTERQLAKSRRR